MNPTTLRPSLLALPLLLASVVLVGCSDETNPVSGTLDTGATVRPADPGGEVPFRGRCTTVLDPEAAPVFESGNLIGLDLFAEGTCQLAHLGRSAVKVVTQIRFADCDFGADVCTTTGTATYTAANGDQLFMSTLSTDTPAVTPPVFSFTGTDMITGGTGRFRDAGGVLEVEVFVDQVAGRAHFEFDGLF